ncbi:translation initiation factor IF-2-like [Betta splendens]|uniref:Translation initiation factor IF-2-like n=1 Tax=Betta splendens TaxID=158456 RepID=A0A9W2XFA2_BETSP|nr:translation initiation factor IF-2-like [Betta splendens]XP_055360334.1 translation initiation factor IF-2-like [Betta splendens]
MRARLCVVNLAVRILKEEHWWVHYPGVRALFARLQALQADLKRARRTASARDSPVAFATALPVAAPSAEIPVAAPSAEIPVATPSAEIPVTAMSAEIPVPALPAQIHVTVAAPLAQTPASALTTEKREPTPHRRLPRTRRRSPRSDAHSCRGSGSGSGTKAPFPPAKGSSYYPEDTPTFIPGMSDSLFARICRQCSPPVVFLLAHFLDSASTTTDPESRQYRRLGSQGSRAV